MLDQVGGERAPAVFADRSAATETLHRMATVDRYNDWIFRKLGHHLGRRVLEVGCGTGNMTPYFLGLAGAGATSGPARGRAGCDLMTCIDVDDESVELVQRRFAAEPRVHTLHGDICEPETVTRVRELAAGASAASARAEEPPGYDTITCINVLEHIEDDALALRHMKDVLVPGGKLLLFVPAGMYLFGALDVAVGHYRRYTLRPLVELLRGVGYSVDESFYMNAAGIPGWFLSSRILRRSTPPLGLLSLFNLLAPAFIKFEETFHPSFGQSIVCVARKPAAHEQ